MSPSAAPPRPKGAPAPEDSDFTLEFLNSDPSRTRERGDLFITGIQNVLGNFGYANVDISHAKAHYVSDNRLLVTGLSMEATRAVTYRFRDAEWCGIHLRCECRAINQELSDTAQLRARAYDKKVLSLPESSHISQTGTLPPLALANFPTGNVSTGGSSGSGTR